jgi:hypothetical protein
MVMCYPLHNLYDDEHVVSLTSIGVAQFLLDQLL